MNSSRTLRWVALALTLIVIGITVNYVASKKTIDQMIETDYAVADPAFRNSLGNLIGPQFLPGNAVVTLLNGDQIFPAMLEGIRSATNSVTLETYIWESGKVGSQFMGALMERARAGVVVSVIVDGMGTLKLKNADIDQMKSAGVRFVKFGRARWYKIKLSMNHRTHRKLLVIDGRVGFTGGVCVADKWTGCADQEDHWRDTQFRVEGPAVRQMQGVFADNWLLTTGEVLQGERYFPEIDPKGRALVQCFKSGPKQGEESARLVHLLAIAAARKNIRLSHAYFVPDDLAVKTLVAACRRGVKVQVIVPARNDSKIGRAASRSRWGALVDAGVEIFEFQPSLFHCKEMIVDDVFVSAGSVNFDNRSFRINDEANINVLDRDFAARQVEVFESDKAHSSLLTAAELHRKPWYAKAADRAAGLLRSIL
jgi:cardiolipin synthase